VARHAARLDKNNARPKISTAADSISGSFAEAD
jgi:hypothetical protein